MTGLEFLFLAGGTFIGALIVAVFDAPRFWSMHETAVRQKATILEQSETITHLEAQVHPLRWDDDDPQVSMRVKERIYDKHVGLMRPGSEILGPFGQEDDDG